MPISANSHVLIRWNLILKHIKIQKDFILFKKSFYSLTAIILFLFSSQSFAKDYFLLESFAAKSSNQDRRFISLDIGEFSKEQGSGSAPYLKARLVSISEPSRSFTEDSSGIYLGFGVSGQSTIAPYIEAGIDVVDLVDIIVEEALELNEECEETNTCEHVHRDAYIKVGIRATINKRLLVGAFFERIAITNDDTIGFPYHNVTGLSLGYLF